MAWILKELLACAIIFAVIGISYTVYCIIGRLIQNAINHKNQKGDR